MDIRIQTLVLDNFKCHRHLELDFRGGNASVYGDNATGKTSVYDAFVWLLFGKETKGLPEDFLEQHRESCVKIPMRAEARSLNLSNAVAITVFEALRQLNFPGLTDHGKMKHNSL